MRCFILSLIILIFSLNAISATADNNTTTNTIYKINEHGAHKQQTENIVYVDTNSASSKEDGSNSTVHIAKGTYNLKPTNITKDIQLVGDNKGEVIFTSDSESSIFTIQKGKSLLINSITLQDHTSTNNPLLTNNGNLQLVNTLFSNNSGLMGGSIFNHGNLHVNQSIFQKNTASFGSAIYNDANVTIINSSFINNSISNVGGAIYSTNGIVNISDSYFAYNRAVSGAAIYNAFGYLEINHTTFLEQYTLLESHTRITHYLILILQIRMVEQLQQQVISP